MKIRIHCNAIYENENGRIRDFDLFFPNITIGFLSDDDDDDEIFEVEQEHLRKIMTELGKTIYYLYNKYKINRITIESKIYKVDENGNSDN
ncbi:MAG: hypothetical protein ACTSQS_18305 [Promethearchaeota archaeon]